MPLSNISCTETESQAQEMLDKGIVQPPLSPYAAPIVMVKQGDKWRLCIDYKDMNSCTASMLFPLPNIKATIERLRGKRVFATLDLRSGYYQFRVHEDT